MTDFDGDNHAHEPNAAELVEMDRGEEMASLTERLLHPVYVDPSKAMGGYILDPVTVRRDLTAAAEELVKLRQEVDGLKNQPADFGSGGGVTVSVGGTQGGGFATGERGGRGGGGGVGPEGMNISNVTVGAPTHKDGHPIIKKVTPNVADGPINYVILASCKDGSSHKNNGETLTWAELMKSVGTQLQEWIDQDGYNVQIIAISATRDPVQHRRTSPV